MRVAAGGVLVALQFGILPEYTSANFTTEWKNIMGSNFDANFWVKNLFDKLNPLYISNQMGQFGYATATYAPPREIGLNIHSK